MFACVLTLCYNLFMELYEECKSCLFNSQLKKVERDQSDTEKLAEFKNGVKTLCKNPPENYCAPLLMRDINVLHKRIFGGIIDYSREKKLFNGALLKIEEKIYSEIMSSDNPVSEALKFAMAANYIDFARIADLDEKSVDYVISSAKKAVPVENILKKFKTELSSAKTLCYLHDNCGEIVLDKVLIRVIKKLYPQICITSVVRGGAVINDVTRSDALEVGLEEYANITGNGTDIPGTYLKEVSEETLSTINKSDIIISKGLGNLETLYGEISAYFIFTCKCDHIAERFSSPLWSAVFTFGN